jgi:predicted DNA-binding transcriptional regulator AlpA
MMFDTRLLVDWKTLKELGWPYSRAHTHRLIRAGRFPKPHKFGEGRGCRIAWYWSEIEPFLRPPTAIMPVLKRTA